MYAYILEINLNCCDIDHIQLIILKAAVYEVLRKLKCIHALIFIISLFERECRHF